MPWVATVTALTVDHRLRPEAADEAAQVAGWLGRRGIAHQTLVRDGALPAGGVQAGARRARYGLLEGWCGEHGVLHLLTAHHREDQAETLLLRLARGSGLDGLAGMAAVVERGWCRVLRPFLAVPRDRLAATLRASGQDWLDDPSNRNPAFARTRLRGAAVTLAAEGLSPARLAATARSLARARAALESDVAAALARTAWLHPAGFAWLDAAGLAAVPCEIGLRALGAVLAAVGGADHPPRFAAIERLYGALRSGGAMLGAGRTLGGCRVLPRRGRILVCREPALVESGVAAAPGAAMTWDGRFVLRLPGDGPGDLTLGALGDRRMDGPPGIPPAARVTLPALRDEAGIVAVPHLGFWRDDVAPEWRCAGGLIFRPARSLTQGSFTVV